jgi:hypothetical protein
MLVGILMAAHSSPSPCLVGSKTSYSGAGCLPGSRDMDERSRTFCVGITPDCFTIDKREEIVYRSKTLNRGGSCTITSISSLCKAGCNSSCADYNDGVRLAARPEVTAKCTCGPNTPPPAPVPALPYFLGFCIGAVVGGLAGSLVEIFIRATMAVGACSGAMLGSVLGTFVSGVAAGGIDLPWQALWPLMSVWVLILLICSVSVPAALHLCSKNPPCFPHLLSWSACFCCSACRREKIMVVS